MKQVVRFFKMAALITGWPFFSRRARFPYCFVVYPGSLEDIQAYFPPGMIELARKVLPPIFPIGRLGAGLVLATFHAPGEIEASPELAAALHRHILEMAGCTQTFAVALAGRLPGVLIAHGQVLQHPIVAGDRGTVHAVTQSVHAVCVRHNLARNTPIAVIGAKGFIGSRLIEHLRRSGYTELIAHDIRYAQRSHNEGVLYTSRAQDLTTATIVVVLTAKGEDIAPLVPSLQGKIVVDDTHPQLPHWLVRDLQANGCQTYKMALTLPGVHFDPPLPGYRRRWLPGCVWEAAVIAGIQQRGEAPPQSQEEFDRAADRLPFGVVLESHFDNVRR